MIGIGIEVEIIIRRPIGKLVNASRALARGTYSFTITNYKNDEIGELTYYFLEMRSALEKNHISLKNEINVQRRKADDLALRKAESDYKAYHDALTGQINRQGFERALYNALCESSEYKERSVLLYLDLDRFKSVNDSCGHLAGDRILQEVSASMKSEIREEDSLGRLGGDEFGIILKSCSLKKAHEIASGIINRVVNYRFNYEERSFSIGVSIGVAEYDGDIASTESWLQRADKACYIAKNSGRGQVVTYKHVPEHESDPIH
ncbi:GGDEF domain-containing protein [Pontibacterium sp. N1Y112]|uniref:GGDEF domain-containing protein n=1 Tax=Pontibacterium sinense TaxID=2781979 RepID=A0A8J7K043_9GAMM|nr:GGDEF domain-containing protein [Pontibacterium sinense]MBE9398534.1 GGDEF domain-containing protein [Pontibacterium sinense]